MLSNNFKCQVLVLLRNWVDPACMEKIIVNNKNVGQTLEVKK